MDSLVYEGLVADSQTPGCYRGNLVSTLSSSPVPCTIGLDFLSTTSVNLNLDVVNATLPCQMSGHTVVRQQISGQGFNTEQLQQTASPSPSSKGLSTGAIIGIAVGLGVLLCVVLVFFCFCYKGSTGNCCS